MKNGISNFLFYIISYYGAERLAFGVIRFMGSMLVNNTPFLCLFRFIDLVKFFFSAGEWAWKWQQGAMVGISHFVI